MTGPEVLAWLRERAGVYARGARTHKRDGNDVQADTYKRVAAEFTDAAADLEARL